VFNDIEDAIEGLVGPLGDLITALVSGLVPVLPAVVQLLGQAATLFQQSLISAVKSLVTAIVPLVPVLAKMATAIVGIMSSGLQALGPLLVTLAPYILAIVAGVKAWSIAQGILDAVMDANPFVLLAVALVAVVGLVVEMVKHWHDLAAAAKTAFDAVKNAIATAFDWVKSHWPLLLAILTGPIGLAVLFIVDHWKQIYDGAKQWLGDVISFFKGLPGKILNALGDLGTLLLNAGKDVVRGFINGIESMFADVASAALNMVESLGKTVLHALGIGSPSKVAHGWGLAVAQGMANGIDAGAAGTAAAARRMAVGVTAGGAAAAAALGAAASPAAIAAAAGGGKLTAEWIGGQSDQQFMTWIKKNIRLRGGDQTVLGS
jgi:phage-related protein